MRILLSIFFFVTSLFSVTCQDFLNGNAIPVQPRTSLSTSYDSFYLNSPRTQYICPYDDTTANYLVRVLDKTSSSVWVEQYSIESCPAGTYPNSNFTECIEPCNDDDNPKPNKTDLQIFSGNDPTGSKQCIDFLSNNLNFNYELDGNLYNNLSCWYSKCGTPLGETAFLQGDYLGPVPDLNSSCPAIPNGKLTVDVTQDKCNDEFFQSQQPVTGLEGNDYSPWYYSNFDFDTCRNICTYEKVYCPENQAYGWNENSCVVPPDRGEEECSGDFYCINITITIEGTESCRKKCYCNSQLVSDTAISCSTPDDTNTTSNEDTNTTSNEDTNTTGPGENSDNEDNEDQTSIDNNSTDTTQTPSDCTANQSYNYSTQKCENITDTNTTNPEDNTGNLDTNTTGTVDSNTTSTDIDLLRKDLNITNSILKDILAAIKEDSNSTSTGAGGGGTEEDESNETQENNSSGDEFGEVEDMLTGQYDKKYIIFNTDCGSPSFEESATYMGEEISNPFKIAHEKISPFIGQIKIIVILSATLLGLISIFRR